MPKITKRFIDSLKANTDDKIYWDDNLKGFGVRTKPSGTQSYLVQYRNQYGRSKRLTIGKVGTLTPDESRQMAIQHLASVSKGTDPAQEKHDIKKLITVSGLCDLYMLEGTGRKKPSTLATDKGRIERHVKPLIGNRIAADIHRGDVEQMMHDIANGKTATTQKTKKHGKAIVKGGKGTATKAVTLLGAIYTFALKRNLRNDNPAHGIDKYPDKKNERFLSNQELEGLGGVLQELEQDNRHLFSVQCIRLLLLTGCRRGEITSLQWDDIDTERKCIRLSDTKTGARLVPLADCAITLLQALPKLSSPFVFPSTRAESSFTGLPKTWRTIIRPAAKIDDVRIHDLRHTFASIAAELGYSQPTIGALLGHAGSGTTGRYVHFGRDPLGAAANHIADTIAERLDGKSVVVGIKTSA